MQRILPVVAVLLALALAGCGGGHHDLVPVAQQMDSYVNAHNVDGFASLLTDDVYIKAPDGTEHKGRDSARAWMAAFPSDFHVETRGYRQSGDTVMWDATLRSSTYTHMGLPFLTHRAMAVFSGDKIRYFAPSMTEETAGAMEFLDFYRDVVNGGNLDAVDKYCTADMVDHGAAPPNSPKGAEGVKAFFKMIRQAYPDLQATPTLVFAEGPYVFVGADWTGTNKASFMGMPATNKKMTWTVGDVVRLENGKAAEHWGWDDMAARMAMARGK